MKRSIFKFELFGESDWIIALNVEEAKTVYEREFGLSESEPEELSEKNMEESFMIDPNESEPDPNEEDYNEEDYCNGYKITGTMTEYLKDNGHYSHHLASSEF